MCLFQYKLTKRDNSKPKITIIIKFCFKYLLLIKDTWIK